MVIYAMIKYLKIYKYSEMGTLFYSNNNYSSVVKLINQLQGPEEQYKVNVLMMNNVRLGINK